MCWYFYTEVSYADRFVLIREQILLLSFLTTQLINNLSLNILQITTVKSTKLLY